MVDQEEALTKALRVIQELADDTMGQETPVGSGHTWHGVWRGRVSLSGLSELAQVILDQRQQLAELRVETALLRKALQRVVDDTAMLRRY